MREATKVFAPLRHMQLKKNKSLIWKQTLAEEDNVAIYNTIQHAKSCIYSENLSQHLVYRFF